MAEYIEREATCKDCVHYDICIFHHHGDENKKCVHFKNKADVVEVRHGRWVGENNMRLNLPTLLEYDDWHCSECGNCYPERHISRLSNYCPNCGAKMDGKGETE